MHWLLALTQRYMASCIILFLIIFSLCFAKTCVAATANSSSIRANYTYYLDSGLPSTWYNNNSVVMDGWQMTVLLMYPKDPRFFCGFFCTGTCKSYFFSVVQVVGGNASLIWSPNRDRPVQKNAMVQLTRDGGLSLRDSNGTRVWSSNTTGNSIAGMNLTEAGKLVLFNNEGTRLWQSTIMNQTNITSTNTTSQNEYCSSGDGLCSEGLCSCPVGVDGIEYFKQNQSQFAEVGCSRITPLSCNSPLDRHELVEVRNFTYLSINETDEAFPDIKDMEGCKQACLQNCSCGGAFFRYDSDPSDGYCFMPSRILVIREGQTVNYTFTPTSFIKVQIPSLAPSPFPAEEPEDLPPLPPEGGHNLVAIAAGSGAGAFLLVCFLIYILSVKWRKAKEEEEEEEEAGDGYTNHQVQVPGMPVRFSYEDLRRATEEFKERLGRGGFGSVFKGMLPDGTKIAVKRLDKKGKGMRGFLAEVETIGSIHHFNLVRLIGFCAEKSNRLLVYEYMSNGSLDNWIFHRSQGPCLDWQTRRKIILDIAKGLAYLHEDCRQTIVHLDIKPQNILLDENFNAKVSDFGLSKLIDKDESQVLITMRGTPGYLAPEWRESKITVKVDIYSFGIVLLEIVTGRRQFDQTRAESSSHMLGLLQKKAEEARLIDIVEILDGDMNNREELERMIKIGAWCLQDDHTRRPPMSVVVKVLEGVMEVDSNIIYKFVHAMAPPAVVNDRVSTAVEASILSNPR